MVRPLLIAFRRFFSLLARPVGADAVLALGVVAIVALMIVPLPTWLLDLLIAANLSIAVTILVIVLFVKDAVAIATFPTLLLLTTLYRLALNVSSTRLILLQADAGDVIRAFGKAVVRGNYVVGAVIFLILTIIQFVVIAKGSERVAEVGARFVLDAMPGKQMAIDAELRSGSIDGNEARRRRRALTRESQFYGSMDGAMKFVKGDVIASLIITVVNVVGGLTIGVGSRGMAVGEALKRYGLLTIGDGLVSQIPALVLSTAAGVLVTRTASEEPDTSLGRELSNQLLSAPRALTVSALFVGALALAPGLPAIPFLVIGVALFFASRAATATRDSTIARIDATNEKFVPQVAPWSIELSPRLATEMQVAGGSKFAANLPGFSQLRSDIFRDLGLPLAPPQIAVLSADASLTRRAVISIYEVPAKTIDVPETITDASAWIWRETRDVLTARAADLFGMHETQRLLDELEQLSPAVVRNVVPKPVSLTLLTDILRRLLDETICIRDLRAILEALAPVAATEKDPLALAEFVRAQLRRAITYRYTEIASASSQSRVAAVYLLDPFIEETIRGAITRTAAGAFLTLAPAPARDIIESIKQAIPAKPPRSTVVLTQPDVRRFVRKLIEVDLPGVAVLSFAELLPEVQIRPIARAELR